MSSPTAPPASWRRRAMPSPSLPRCERYSTTPSAASRSAPPRATKSAASTTCPPPRGGSPRSSIRSAGRAPRDLEVHDVRADPPHADRVERRRTAARAARYAARSRRDPGLAPAAGAGRVPLPGEPARPDARDRRAPRRLAANRAAPYRDVVGRMGRPHPRRASRQLRRQLGRTGSARPRFPHARRRKPTRRAGASRAAARRDRRFGPANRRGHPQGRHPAHFRARDRLEYARQAALSPLMVGGASVSPRRGRPPEHCPAQPLAGAVMARRVLFHVQYLLGIGHLQRSLRIAEALVAAGIDVTLVQGGPPVPEIERDPGIDPGIDPGVDPGIDIVQLPSIRARDATFALVGAAGEPVDDALRAGRGAPG